MSSHTYPSTRPYSYQKPIIHLRDSSTGSHSSYSSNTTNDSRDRMSSSSGYHQSSSTNRDSHHSGSHYTNEPREYKYRVPDNNQKYITTTTRGSVQVINHKKGIKDPQAPRSADALPHHFREAAKPSPSYPSTTASRTSR